MAGVLAQLKVIIAAETSKLKSGLDEAAVRSDLAGKKIAGTFKNLGATFARAIGPLSETGREVSFALQGIGESAEVAQGAMTRFGAAAAVAGSVATAGLLALTGLTVKMFQHIDEQDDLAKGLGLTTGEYVKLTSAMKLYGIEQQQIAPGFSQFEKIISGLMRSKAGAVAIQQLGLSMQQLRGMSTHEQLLAVAEAFSKLPPSVNKTAIAAQLFTATLGAKMIPLLEQGRAGVEKLESKYSDLADESEKLAETTKNVSIQFSHAFSALEGASLKAAGGLGIPTMILAVAHPLATVKALVLDLGSALTGFLSKWLGALRYFIGKYNELLSSVHLPTVSVAGLDKSVQYMKALSESFKKQAANAAEPFAGSGETPPKGGGTVNSPPAAENKVVAYLKALKQQIAEFGKGDVAKGIDQLKRLGATQKQLAEGKGLLEQLDLLKREKAFTDGFNKAQESFTKVLDKLVLPKETLDGWNKLSKTLDGIVDSLREAGAEALGFKQNTFASQLQAQGAAAAGSLGGKIGGETPVFTPRGFGEMRFNMEKLGQSAQKLGETFSHSFIRMIESGQSFGDILKSLRTELELFIIKALVFKEIASALKGAGGFLGVIGNFFGGMAAPGRASGGPVAAGSLYKVGERGPEYFVPGVAGQIVPASAGKGSTMVFAPRMYINTPNADSFRKSQAQILSEGYRQMATMHARNG